MRISTQAFYERTGGSMNALQQKLFRVQQQLSAGTKFLKPSENPVAASRALGVSQSLAETAQYAASRSRANQALSMEESALQSATRVLQGVKSLIIQAGNGTLSNSDRATLATSLEGQFAELLGVANADDGNGQYLFAGYKSDAPPFVQQANGLVGYAGDQGQRLVQVDVSRRMAAADDGVTVFRSVQGSASRVAMAGPANAGDGVFRAVSVTDTNEYTITFGPDGAYQVDDGTTQTSGTLAAGQPVTVGGLTMHVDGSPADGDVFQVRRAENAGTDVFATIRELINVLRTPATDNVGLANLRNALSTANVKITNAHDNVLTVRSSVGSRLAELESLDAGGAWRNIVDERYLSELQDLDYASALSEFAQREMNLRATQQTFARLQNISLFNYL